MFFDQFSTLCKQNNTNPTQFVTNILHLSSSKVTAWKNGSIPKYEILHQIAKYFDVSVGYLFDGENAKTNASKITLSENEQELLEVFGKFTDREQIKIIGKMEEWLAEKQRRAATATTKPNVQTAYIASRSFDNMPPRTVTGDFSDVLNAPDATDEY